MHPNDARAARPYSFCRSIVVLLACLLPAALAAAPAQDAGRTTVPLVLGDNNRPYVDVTLHGPAGQQRTARMLVDTGGGAFILGEDLARSIGLEWGEVAGEGPESFARVTSTIDARLGGMSLSLVPERVLVAVGRSGMPKDEQADGLFPGNVLAQYHVIFDYPAGELTLAEPGTVEPRGERLPMGVSQPLGFPRTEVRIGGRDYGFLLDTGPPATIVSHAVMQRWGEANPGWQRHDGAAGIAAELQRAGGSVLETMTVEGATWGSFELEPFAVAAQREGVFEDYMSRLMSAPIIGALGGNVLREFRVELDYAGEALYLSRP